MGEVHFYRVLDSYPNDAPLECTFECSEKLIRASKSDDTLCIMKLGWSKISERVYQCTDPRPAAKNTIKIDSFYLPKDTESLYQFCYFYRGLEEHLMGASAPFQFTAAKQPFDSLINHITVEKEEEMNKLRIEINTLKLENSTLKHSLEIVKKNGDFEDLKATMERQEQLLQKHDQEIVMLKKKIVEGAEVYKQLYADKMKAEGKYRDLKEKTKTNKQGESVRTSNSGDYVDLGELEPIPPFPKTNTKKWGENVRTPNSCDYVDLGELEPIPPFPSILVKDTL